MFQYINQKDFRSGQEDGANHVTNLIYACLDYAYYRLPHIRGRSLGTIYKLAYLLHDQCDVTPHTVKDMILIGLGDDYE